MTSADSNSPRTYLYRLVTVRCKLKKNISAFAKNCYCPRTYLPRTVTVRGLLLSGVVPATDYYCPRTYLPRTVTVRGHTCSGLLQLVQKGGIGPSSRPSTCFLQDKKTWIVLFFTFFKISFEWDTFFKFCLQIWNQHKILHFLIPKLTYLKKKSFKLWTVLLLAANKQDFA